MTGGRCARGLVTALAFAAATVGIAGCGASAENEPAVPTLEPAEYAQQLFDLTNDERAAQDLEELEWSDCLVEPATERAQVAADSDGLEHETLSLDCAEGAMAGENLSRADVDPQEIVDRWMDSAGHKANILTEEFAVGAVGCVLDEAVMTCSWLAHAEPGTSGGTIE